MKILLMGGSGWLGHHIALRLAAENRDVTILSRGRKPTFQDAVSELPSVIADKEDEAAMRQVFGVRYTHVIDTVPTEKSIALVHKYAAGLRHYLHCSSTGGYAPPEFIPCNETAHYKGFAPGTGWDQKRIVDNLVMALCREHGFPATVIRPSCITGPGMLPLDNLGGRRRDFIPDILAGKTLDLPENGKALLHPVHVRDLACSFALAMDRPERSVGQVYNICLGYAVTLNRYLEITAAALGRRPVIHYMSVEEMLAKYGDRIDPVGLRFLAEHMCFSIEKAASDLGYRPSMSTEEAIAETALWAAGLR